MRIWSVHPRYLDRQGLVACWRETLLAQAVLAGRTKGYTAHPQLRRWRETSDPLGAVVTYLDRIADEADSRGYNFDRSRLDDATRFTDTVPVTQGQLDYEWSHLSAKLAQRSPEWLAGLAAGETVEPHPAFRVVPGDAEDWEVR